MLSSRSWSRASTQFDLGLRAAGPGDGQVDQRQLDPDAEFDEVDHGDVAAGEVDRDHIAYAAHAGSADEQTATGASPHGGDLMVLQEAEGLTEHRPARAVALDQGRLGTDECSGRQVVGDDVLQDGPGHFLGPLVAHAASESHAAGQDLARQLAILQEGGLGFEMAPHPAGGAVGVVLQHRLNDPGVRLP